MSRRTVAGLLALGLAAVFIAYGGTRPVGYVPFRPGPTFDVLGTVAGLREDGGGAVAEAGDGGPVVRIKGHRVYRDDGQLRMVTVRTPRPESEFGILALLDALLERDTELLPRDVVFGEEITDEQQREQSAAQMSSSQDDAVAAALTAAGIDYGTRPSIDAVSEDGPADGILRPGDVILAVDGRRTPDAAALVAAIQAVEPGATARLTLERGDRRRAVRLRTEPSPEDPTKSRIGVFLSPYDFPVSVSIGIPEEIGGPSAGMIFALTIYDLLTPGSLTGGRPIAGSGTITADGVVGPIGGVGQKIASAERDGAELFLVAQDNCAEAAAAHYDPEKIRLVRVDTLAAAIDDLEAYRDDPDADLPRC